MMGRIGGDLVANGAVGELPVKGGLLKVSVAPGEGRKSIASVEFSSTFKAEPEGVWARLGEALASSTIDEAPARIEDFFSRNPQALPGLEPEDILTVLTLAFMKVRRASSQAPDPAAWKQGPGSPS